MAHRPSFLDLGHSNNSNENSSEFKKEYQISGIGTKSHVIMKTNTNHTLQTDVPKSMGGTNKAPQPVETLLAAWMGCTQATALYVARNMNVNSGSHNNNNNNKSNPTRIQIDKIEFENVQAVRDERGALGGTFPLDINSEFPDVPARLERVYGVVKVYASEQQQRRRRKEEEEQVVSMTTTSRIILSEAQLHILSEQTERRCPVGKKKNI